MRYLGINVTKDGLNVVKKYYKIPQIQMIKIFTNLITVKIENFCVIEYTTNKVKREISENSSLPPPYNYQGTVPPNMLRTPKILKVRLAQSPVLGPLLFLIKSLADFIQLDANCTFDD